MFACCCKKIPESVHVPAAPPTLTESIENSPSAWVMAPNHPDRQGYYLVKVGTENKHRELTAYWGGRFWTHKEAGAAPRALFDVLAYMNGGEFIVSVHSGVGLEGRVFRA